MGNQQEESNGKTLIETLTKRFTCKRYDPEGGVSDDDFATILEAARLSPSSFGFEPWKLLVIERPGLVDEIREQAWGAKRNADRTVVILARRDVTAESAWVHHITHDIQGLSEADEQTRLETFAKLQRDDLHVLDNERTLFDWAGKQTYIALANMLTAAALLGELLENDSVTIYCVAGGSRVRLVAASPEIAFDVARSLSLQEFEPIFEGARSGLWVNRALTPGLPMFGYIVEHDGAPTVLIFVRDLAESQMTLYHQNIFRILCGLVERALVRAFDYEAVAQEKRCITGTRVLKQEPFARELAAEQALRDNKMGSYLLLRVVPGTEPVGELVGAIGSAIRESDAAGLVDGDTLYLLMRQARDEDLCVIRERLAAKQIAVEPVDGEGVVALLQRIAPADHADEGDAA